MRNPVPPATIRLRGIRSVTAFSDNKVWLDHKRLKLGKSLKVKAHSINGFGWGKDEKGAAQLALAICLEIYPPDVAGQVYRHFKSAFLTAIEVDCFDLNLHLTEFNEVHLPVFQEVV
ncbi:MAG: hypothetical protein HY842_02015 [Bacteroidetes bacterium]|nr:hypothetical protein [Bacteroidota bacterium]